MKQLTLLLLLWIGIFHSGFAQQYSKVKIFTGSKGLAQLSQMGVAVDHGFYKKNTFFISDFSTKEIQVIEQAGFEYVVLIQDVSHFYANRSKQTDEKISEKATNACPTANAVNNDAQYPVPSHFNLGSMGGYYTYQEFLQELDEMASVYPNLITVRDTISSFLSHENRPIFWVRISDNPTNQEAEPELLYTAIHHAREPESMTQLICFMWYLLENYGTNDEVTAIIEHTQLYFVPLINPDGYCYNQTTNPNGGGMWRKNRRNNGDGTFGVDNNRNYSYGWNTTGTSQNTSNETYCGPSAFSEPENQAVRWLAEQHNFRFALNYHTYGNLLLYPIGTTIAAIAPHNDYFAMIAEYMAAQNGYLAQKSSGLYPASGDSDDYLYMEDVGVGLKDSVFSMTPEIGSNQDGFWPSMSRIVPIAQENVFPNLVVSHLTHRYASIHSLDQSVIDTNSGFFNVAVRRMGLENGAITVSINPILNIQNIGAPIVLNLAIGESDSIEISFHLTNGTSQGDTVKYEILTDFTTWTKHDTIVRIFNNGDFLQFLDPANDANNWSGVWNTTSEDFVSSSKSFTDSPNQNYTDNTTTVYKLITPVDLTYSSKARAQFYTRFNIETDYDYVAFEASTDNGNTWQQLCGKYTNLGVPQQNWMGQDVGIQPIDEPIYDGIQSTWVLEEVNLNDLAGQIIQLRFKLQSDGGQTEDGFYFDDFKLFFDSIDISNIEEYTQNSFELFPNPTSNQFIFKCENNETWHMRIYNRLGKLVMEKANVSNGEVIQTNQLSKGIYFVNLQSSEKALTQKLIKR